MLSIVVNGLIRESFFQPHAVFLNADWHNDSFPYSKKQLNIAYKKASMYQYLKTTLENVYKSCQEKGLLKEGEIPPFIIEEPPNKDFGDYSSNIAMLLARREKKAPRAVAQTIVEALSPLPDNIKKVEIAGPGFINFFISEKSYIDIFEQIQKQNVNYGRSKKGNDVPIQVEFVSANPTGPLHFGHGRGAVVGDVLANLLDWSGYKVSREFFVNDAGKQIQNLGKSLYARYKEEFGQKINFPEDGYQGQYITKMAKELKEKQGEHFLELPEKEAVKELSRIGVSKCLENIKKDLADFGVLFDEWVSEKSLFEKNLVQETIEALKEKGVIYQDKEAWWLASSRFGDEKDRVVIRSNGEPTYFASDIAYHKEKFERGFKKVINIWGADHHGYVPRVKAALSSMDIDKDKLEVLLVQLVNLLRDGEAMTMSKRQGTFITLSEVVEEVGSDVARFFFLMRSCDTSLDFDIELAKKESTENPVYYVQYAHARISSILRSKNKSLRTIELDKIDISLLSSDDDRSLVRKIGEFPRIVENTAKSREPHKVAFYLQELAGEFHKYYNKNRIIGVEEELSKARLALIASVKQVLSNGFKIIGITPMEKM